MQIELRKLSEIKPYHNNPRVNDPGVDAVVKSVKEFGFRQPIVVDADGVIVAGNGTFAAANALGWKSIDVVRTKLRGPTARAFASADNRTAGGT
jgi:ParB-like chromosome segregation protein Spo0J